MPASPRNLIAPQLRRLRNERGLSQAALAATAQRLGWDLSRDIIKHIESGERSVTDIELVLLARCFGVATDSLLPTGREAVRLALARVGG